MCVFFHKAFLLVIMKTLTFTKQRFHRLVKKQTLHIQSIYPMFYDTQTIALLAIVAGLIVLCLGIWHVWNAQQVMGSEMLYLRGQCEMIHKQQRSS